MNLVYKCNLYLITKPVPKVDASKINNYITFFRGRNLLFLNARWRERGRFMIINSKQTLAVNLEADPYLFY